MFFIQHIPPISHSIETTCLIWCMSPSCHQNNYDPSGHGLHRPLKFPVRHQTPRHLHQILSQMHHRIEIWGIWNRWQRFEPCHVPLTIPECFWRVAYYPAERSQCDKGEPPWRVCLVCKNVEAGGICESYTHTNTRFPRRTLPRASHSHSPKWCKCTFYMKRTWFVRPPSSITLWSSSAGCFIDGQCRHVHSDRSAATYTHLLQQLFFCKFWSNESAFTSHMHHWALGSHDD